MFGNRLDQVERLAQTSLTYGATLRNRRRPLGSHGGGLGGVDGKLDVDREPLLIVRSSGVTPIDVTQSIREIRILSEIVITI